MFKKKILKNSLRKLFPRTVRCHRIWRGPLKGMHIVTSWHDYPGAILGRTEAGLLSWFEANVRSGETWIDVGAHYGYTALALCRLVGPSGRVFAFEPMISTAGFLAQTRRLNGFSQLTVVPLALAAPESLAIKQLATTRGMVYHTNETSQWKEVTLVTRLDWVWAQICGGELGIQGIKIDVQGMEIETLEGMSDLLRTFRPKLVVEVHHGVDRGKLLDVIEAVGYSRRGAVIEPLDGEVEPRYYNDHSYAFVSN